MIWQLSESIWFGDKPSVVEAANRVQSVICVAHSLRRPYWQNLGHLPGHVWYFRLGLADRDECSIEYVQVLMAVLGGIQAAGKYPLLCHCRAGGHRGPSAAIFAYWCFSGRTRDALNWAIAKVRSLRPGFMGRSDRRQYRDSLLSWARQLSMG